MVIEPWEMWSWTASIISYRRKKKSRREEEAAGLDHSLYNIARRTEELVHW